MARVLLIGDGGVQTGFERVTRAIGTALTAAGHTVIHRAVGYDPRKPLLEAYPYELRPLWTTPDDPLGITKLPSWIRQDKPDGIVMVHDIWQQVSYMGHLPEGLPTVGYYPVDAPNVKWMYGLALGGLTDAVPYTQFGAHESALAARAAVDVIMDTNRGNWDAKVSNMRMELNGMKVNFHPRLLAERQNPEAYRPIPHGLDPLHEPIVDKAEARKHFGIPEDAFVVLNVNTNQFRKRLDITIRGFAELAKWNPKAMLVLHCAGRDNAGWDLVQLAQLYGVQNQTMLIHMAQSVLTDEQLHRLYCAADVQVNTGGGEGWGLPAFEGAQRGVPQMVPDWSATRELWSGHGVLLPVADYRFPAKRQNTAHACLDVEIYGRLLVQLSRDPAKLADLGKKALAFASEQPTWAEVGAQFVPRFEQALEAGVPEAITLQEMLDLRNGVLESELTALFRR